MSEQGELRPLREALTAAVAELSGRRRLTVVDLAREGIVVWDVYRDRAGTPQGSAWPMTPWTEISSSVMSEEQAVLDAVRPSDMTAMVLVCTFPQDGRNAKALEWLGRRYPRAGVYTCEVRLDELLRAVVSDAPLTRPYELVTVRRRVSGRLELAGRQLFPIGACRGDTERFSVRCAPSDPHGTVFAVVAYSQEARFQLVSVRAAKLPPGGYDLTAELRRPGLVRFHGLPEQAILAPEWRSWRELVSAVPDRLDFASSATHLICAVEISGPDHRVALRLSAAQRAISVAAAELAGDLRVSVISYGPHSPRRDMPEVPVAVLGWEESADRALGRLRRLEERGGVADGYSLAAQVECVLREVADRLQAVRSGGRTALLTVAAKPAFPRRPHRSGIPPCPGKRDWEAELRRLRDRPGLTLGVILDRGPDGATAPEETEAIWEALGDGHLTELGALDAETLGRSLGLVPAAGQRLPFPLIETP